MATTLGRLRTSSGADNNPPCRTGAAFDPNPALLAQAEQQPSNLVSGQPRQHLLQFGHWAAPSPCPLNVREQQRLAGSPVEAPPLRVPTRLACKAVRAFEQYPIVTLVGLGHRGKLRLRDTPSTCRTCTWARRPSTAAMVAPSYRPTNCPPFSKPLPDICQILPTCVRVAP